MKRREVLEIGTDIIVGIDKIVVVQFVQVRVFLARYKENRKKRH
jgi:hypothetical protein